MESDPSPASPLHPSILISEVCVDFIGLKTSAEHAAERDLPRSL